MIGQNTVSGQQLLAYIERIEALRVAKKEAAEAEFAVLAEAKSNGFDTKIIRTCVKRRAIKPHDLAEADTLLDMYWHAIGMATEPPLFRAMGLGAVDTTAREQIIDRLKAFVPAAGLGDIIVNMDGVKLRLRRDTNGDVFTDEVRDAPAPAPKPAASPAAPKAPVPDVDADGAEDLGRQYARANRPVIDNPFPFGDPRRARFDQGWRKETGNDGMGPDED